MADRPSAAAWLSAALFLFVLALFGGLAWLGNYQCGARWEDSGLRSKWGYGRGCRVEVAPGRWVPEDKVREVPR